jgi:hypothetical protein
MHETEVLPASYPASARSAKLQLLGLSEIFVDLQGLNFCEPDHCAGTDTGLMLRTMNTAPMESEMTTIISNDPVGRFAALDHSVLEEVQAMIEAHSRLQPPANEQAGAVETSQTEPRHVTWMKAAIKAFS